MVKGIRTKINELIEKCIKNTIKNRYKYNKKILTILDQEIERNKEIRFMQVLYNIGITGIEEDRFYEEPKLTYQKIKGKLKY